jgi:hypothetical protein
MLDKDCLPPLAAAVDVADVGLADDGNFRSFVFRFVAGRSGGSDGQESGDDELEKKSEIQLSKHMEMLGGKREKSQAFLDGGNPSAAGASRCIFFLIPVLPASC